MRLFMGIAELDHGTKSYRVRVLEVWNAVRRKLTKIQNHNKMEKGMEG
jgi:hypothetical protein